MVQVKPFKLRNFKKAFRAVADDDVIAVVFTAHFTDDEKALAKRAGFSALYCRYGEIDENQIEVISLRKMGLPEDTKSFGLEQRRNGLLHIYER
jgi:hypothetical protein